MNWGIRTSVSSPTFTLPVPVLKLHASAPHHCQHPVVASRVPLPRIPSPSLGQQPPVSSLAFPAGGPSHPSPARSVLDLISIP